MKYSVQMFLENEIDVYPGAFTNEAVSLRLRGIELREFHPADYGIDTLGNVLFVTEEMIEKRPEAVRKFVKATLRGWEWCLQPENMERAVVFLGKHTKHLDERKELAALKANVALVRPTDPAVPYVGWIEAKKLGSIVSYLRQFGIVNKAIHVPDLYTDRFLARQ